MKLTVKENTTLMEFILTAMHGISRTSAKQLLSNKFVYVNGKPTSKFDFPLSPGTLVEVNKEQKAKNPFNHLIEIIYEDDYLIVADKKEGLLSVAADTKTPQITAHSILNGYVQMNPGYVKRNEFARDPRIFIVHRLDRETSGLMVFAKDEHTKQQLQQNWNEVVTDRRYIALVEGEINREKGRIVSWLTDNSAFITYSSTVDNGGQKAITNYTTLENHNGYAMVELILETGRKNQIRVHMQQIKHSIVGDTKYGGQKSDRLYLHAFKLCFLHPVTGEQMNFTRKPPFEL
ncbi:MAG: RluA family pseudouridine synthase [Bacteroidales bacterium]